MIARIPRPRWTFRSIASLTAIALLFAALPAAAADLSATVGIDSHGRTGMWAECRVTCDEPPTDGSLIVSTVDGDGVAVDYTQPITDANDLRCYFQLGRGLERVRVSLADASGTVTQTTLIDAPQAIPSEKQWILAVGDAIGIQGASDEQGRRDFPVVSLLTDGNQFPHHWSGFDGVDLIVFSGSQATIVNDLADAQKQALADWVRHGGRMVLTLGGQALAAVAPDAWLNKSLGLEIEEQVVDFDPRAIESYSGTQTPLKSFAGLRLPSSGGRTLLTGRTVDRQSAPIVKEYLIGFGRLLVLAADLDQEPFATWPDRQNLLERFVPDVLILNKNTTRHSGAVGYSDIVGQIRRTIDQFGSHWWLPFKLLAGFFVLYLGLIGPLDYWVVNRWIGRPLLGWITFPFAVLVFAGLAFYGTTVATPSQPVVNQFSVVDIDPSENVARGFAWSQYLSGTAKQNDLAFAIQPSFADPDATQPILGWWGVNGEEFGGLASIGRDRQMPSYTIKTTTTDGAQRSTIANGLPLATAATKGLAARWQFAPNTDASSSLKQRTGTDLISGGISNPLDVDLLDAILVYRGWAYLLPTRFAAGQRISQVSTLTSKNLKWRLTRRSVDNGTAATEPWNPELQGDLDRLLEIVMLYDAAGGARYTELNNRIINHLDLSHVLATNHAILIGRVDAAVIQLQGDTPTAEMGTVRSYARILLPVEPGR